MNGLPLHPAVVHVPIGLAVVAPLLALLGLFTAVRGAPRRPLWTLVASVHLLVVCGGLVALRTGEAEEERVERVVPETAIETHEARAERFVWLATAAAATAGAAALVPAGALGTGAALVATVASGATAAGALWVGHSGGELVYRHGAARAYVAAQGGASRREGDADDDD